MLEKIVQIKNVGRFRSYSASGNVTFRKLTLIYAENGRGKTTLCAVLRSLQNGQPEIIAERKTLAATEPAFVHMRLNGTDHKFTNDVWTQQYPDIIIFDPVFVSDRGGNSTILHARTVDQEWSRVTEGAGRSTDAHVIHIAKARGHKAKKNNDVTFPPNLIR